MVAVVSVIFILSHLEKRQFDVHSLDDVGAGRKKVLMLELRLTLIYFTSYTTTFSALSNLRISCAGGNPSMGLG